MDDTINMLPLALLRFQLTIESRMLLQVWPGSVLRGVFGHALRSASCMTRQKNCPDCPLYRTCPYPAIFAPPPHEHVIQHFSQPPVPYLIEPDRWGERELRAGETLQFSMILMGRALTELALITHAWQEAARRSFGRTPAGSATLTKIDYFPPRGAVVPLYRPDAPHLPAFTPTPPVIPALENLSELTLVFTSPLRLQENGHALPPARLTPAVLLMAVVRRVALIAELYGAGTPPWDFKALAAQAKQIQGEKQLHWQDWTRRSARQQRTMQLGGVVGQWRLFGDLTPFFPALYMGQWLHVGKEAVFGMGRYNLEREGMAYITRDNIV